MPRNIYPGRKKWGPVRGLRKHAVDFSRISLMIDSGMLIKPNCQGSLEEDRVLGMIESYKLNPENLMCKNNISIGVINNKFYIVDGQHRVEMACRLYNNDEIKDNVKELIFCYKNLENELELRNWFDELNKDSKKNELTINLDLFERAVSEKCKELLKGNYSDLFAKKATTKGYSYTLSELIENLIQIDFFKHYSTGEDAYKQLIFKNKEFYKKNRYSVEFVNQPIIYYVPEHKSLRNMIVFTLKNANFIEFLKSNAEPYHIKKLGKKRIGRRLKLQCWDKYYPNIPATLCPISNCDNVLRKDLTTKWDAGHIISEKNRGPTELSNLRPICKACNSSMGSTNWDDYDVVEI